MSFDFEEQYRLNHLHASYPCSGDYWHEMMTPIALVHAVTKDYVVLQRLHEYGGKEITKSNPKPHVMSRRAFSKWLRYDSMPEKTWAYVIPRKFVEFLGG